MWLVYPALVATALYGAVMSGMYFAQTRLIFPTTLVQAGHMRLPASAQRLEVEAPSGDRLVGVHIPASSSTGPRGPLLLGFGGNAWSADAMALYCTSASLTAMWSPFTTAAIGLVRAGPVQKRYSQMR